MQPRDSQSSFKSLSGASPLAHYYRLLSLPPLSARHKRWIETQKIMVRSVTCDVLSSRRPSVLTFLSVKTAEAQGMIRLRKYIFQNYLVIEVTIEADSAASSIFPWLSTLHGPHSCQWACNNQHQKVWSQEGVIAWNIALDLTSAGFSLFR